jgi:hypothetical protein
MEQLVGQRCLRCGQGIWSIAEGCFCSSCGSPHHLRCDNHTHTLSHPSGDGIALTPDDHASNGITLAPRDSTHCPACRCNVENRIVARFRDEQRRLAGAPARKLANHMLIVRILLRILVFANLLVAIWLFNKLGSLDPLAGAFLTAPVLVFVGAAEYVARAIYRQEKWAWTGGLIIFLLALPTLVGIAGLFMLLDSRVRQEYLSHSTAEG